MDTMMTDSRIPAVPHDPRHSQEENHSQDVLQAGQVDPDERPHLRTLHTRDNRIYKWTSWKVLHTNATNNFLFISY